MIFLFVQTKIKLRKRFIERFVSFFKHLRQLSQQLRRLRLERMVFSWRDSIHKEVSKFLLNLLLVLLLRLFLMMLSSNFLLMIDSLSVAIIVVIKVLLIIFIFGIISIESFFVILSASHPLHHFLHSFKSIFFILFHLLKLRHVLIVSSKITTQDSLKLFPVFFLNVLHVFSEGKVLILFIDINSIVDQFLKLLVKLFAIFLLCVFFSVDSFDIVVIFLIIRPQLSLLFEKLLGSFKLLLSLFLFLLDDNSYLSQLFKLFELQSFLLTTKQWWSLLLFLFI